MTNQLSLDAPITALSGISPAIAKKFAKLELKTVRDLLYYFPFRHDDFSRIIPIKNLPLDIPVTIKGTVVSIENKITPRQHKRLTEAIISDETGTVTAIWFNQPYLPKILKPDDKIYLSGVLQKSYQSASFINPIFEQVHIEEAALHAGRIVPVYHTTASLAVRKIRSAVHEALPAAETIIDWLPETIRSRNGFPALTEAIKNIHFPASSDALQKAMRRFAFEEFFLAQMFGAMARRELDQSEAPVVPFEETATKNFVGSLPFALTDDQRKSAWAILQDMSRNRPMNRLLEGDVGSGKTVVAAIAALNTVKAGFTVLYLAPTEILALQHARTFETVLKNFPVRIGLLTSGTQHREGKHSSRVALMEAVNVGEIDLLIGTHALLEVQVLPPKVGIVIVDEQHRFGVAQRKTLRSGRNQNELVPHLLSMTATPIPRTLALIAYGDLDLSLIRQLPAGRKPITTTAVRETEREKVYAFIREQLHQGQQAFVVCPLISESDKLGVRAATAEVEKLKKIFSEFSVGLLHGKLPTKDKHRMMEDFKDRKTNLLVATAVIEVGIDVPNATIMIIEGAERFGLAQLHQFRGRIGRGTEASHCFLFPTESNPYIQNRLEVFARTKDGFALAEYDLRERGPGTIYGTDQSGFDQFRMADFSNVELIDLAHKEIDLLLAADPNLTDHPLLQSRFGEYAKGIHLE
ncbi:MAG: ATP-dependent DNA helicase RecG [bacterium]|nr:ATP-dependent DNA helicase RecG [bacterium]